MSEPIETRDRALIDAHKAQGGKVEVLIRKEWRECTLDRHSEDPTSHIHRLLPIESPGGGASTREGEGAGPAKGHGQSDVSTPPPGPTWKERPEHVSTKEWADRCVAHIASGGRVDYWTGIEWRPADRGSVEGFRFDLAASFRFALVHPVLPERPWDDGLRVDIESTIRQHTSHDNGDEHTDWVHDLTEAILRVIDAPQPERVAPPDGVTVIGWTEPTDDEPRSLPSIPRAETPPDGWEVATSLGYAIRPIPEPTAPETERRDALIETAAQAYYEEARERRSARSTSARGTRGPRVLALDLSLTATGVALPDGDVHTIRTRQVGPRRLAALRDSITLTVDANAPIHGRLTVAIEGPAFGRANQMHALGQLAGVIYVALHERGIVPVIVPPSTLKKYATGKGNASKADVLVAAVKRLGYDGSDDNEADALWLRALVMDALGSPVVDMPAVNRSALAAVRELDTEGAA